jgi:TonB-linked SusC/RagA family outer membrane protein
MKHLLRLLLLLSMFYCGLLSLHAQNNAPPPKTTSGEIKAAPLSGKMTIKGKVIETIDGTSEPLASATVVVLNQETQAVVGGAYADDEGNFSIEFEANGPMILRVSLMDYKTYETAIVSGQEDYPVTLVSDAIGLEAVVITALNVKAKKADLGYSLQEVKTKDIIRSGEQNIVQALAAKVAGVQIMSSAGTPGASSSIVIRGASSLTGNNEPLIVVDGVPISNETALSGGFIDGAGARSSGVAMSNRSMDLNPDDIESVTVLKGPAAAALYGTRAGGGTVIITTKKGQKGAGTRISYRAALELSTVNKLPKLNKRFAQGENGVYDPNSAFSWGPEIGQAVDTTGNRISLPTVDNPKDFFQTGVGFGNTLDYSSGTDKSTFRLSVGRLTQSGVVPKSDFTRNSVRASYDSELTRNLQVFVSANYITTQANRTQQGSNSSGVMLGLLRTPPSFRNDGALENPDGTPRRYSDNNDNPFWSVNRIPFDDRVNRIIGNTSLIYSPLSWLSITYRVGLDNYTQRIKNVFPVNSAEVPAGLIRENRYSYRELYQDVLFKAEKTFWSDYKFSFTAGNNLNERIGDILTSEGRNLQLDGFTNLNTAADIRSFRNENSVRIISFFGIGQFQYKDLVNVQITGRHETSSTFGPDNRSLFYPSINASFVFTELSAFKNSSIANWFSFGKVRAAYSMVGIEPGAYQTATYYISPNISDAYLGAGVSFPFLGRAGYSLSNLQGNSRLKPELITGFELGADLRFQFGKRTVSLDFTYYDEQTTNAIFPIPVAASSGYLAAIGNSGKLQNRGIEVVLSSRLWETSTKLGVFGWDLTLNFTRNRNKLIELAPNIDNLLLGGVGSVSVMAIPGQPYGQIYGQRFAKAPNGQMLIDQDGYPIVDPTSALLGNTQPDWMMGISNEFSLGQFSLSFLVDIRKGGKMWNGTLGALNYFGASEQTANDRGQTRIFEGVVERIDDNGNVSYEQNTQSIALGENWYSLGPGGSLSGSGADEQFVQNAGWVRLREVSLGYSFQKLTFVKYLSSIDLGITARNLLLFTDYTGVDPETNLEGAGSNAMGMDYFNMPNTRSYLFSVQFNFK